MHDALGWPTGVQNPQKTAGSLHSSITSIFFTSSSWQRAALKLTFESLSKALNPGTAHKDDDLLGNSYWLTSTAAAVLFVDYGGRSIFNMFTSTCQLTCDTRKLLRNPLMRKQAWPWPVGNACKWLSLSLRLHCLHLTGLSVSTYTHTHTHNIKAFLCVTICIQTHKNWLVHFSFRLWTLIPVSSSWF